MQPLELTDATFASAVQSADKPMLVDFWASWCGPCRAMAPVLDKIAAEQDSRLTVAKVNVDDCPATAQKFGVMSIPTMILFKGGEAVAQVVGARPEESLMKEIESYL